MVTGSATTVIPETVERFRLPTILATLPIHIFTVAFVIIIMISILMTRHLQTRPQRLLAINCGFFVIASLYDLAFDISYLSIVDKPQITVQECSAIRNFVYNPIATQAFVDALERFLMAFFNYDMSLFSVFVLYSLFPLFCIAMAVYNTFITTSLLKTDDICATVRRTSWTNITLIVIQWGSALIAAFLYMTIWIKVRRQCKVDITPANSDDPHPAIMSSNHYYWNNHIVRVFFISCLLPLVLATPSFVFTVLTEYNVYQNPVANVIGVVVLDVTTPITWTLYICCIVHLRKGFMDCIRCKVAHTRHQTTAKIPMESI